jgi:glycosyltransferase involved in cell wall biosynthesis
MRILYYSPHPQLPLDLPSGPGVHMREIMKGFETLGHEVHPLIMGGLKSPDASGLTSAPPQKSSFKQRLKPLVPKVIWQSLKDFNLKRFDTYARQELEAAVATFKPDLIYERGFYLMTSGVEVANAFGIKHMLEMNAPYPEERADMEGRSFLHVEALKAERRQFEATQRIVVVSSALRDYVEKQSPGAAGKTIITPNAINPERFKVSDEQRTAKRQAMGLKSETVIGFVGSIFPYHGVDMLIEAAAEVLKHHPVKVLIVGDGYLLDTYKQRTRELGIEDHIIFTGRVPNDQIAQHIATMDITVMARSNWYGSPVKIFEYGALGKAVIAPDVVPVQDVMVHETDGLLIRPNVNDLTAQLNRLLDNEALRSQLGSTWSAKVHQHHTWQQMAQKILTED